MIKVKSKEKEVIQELEKALLIIKKIEKATLE